MPDAPASGAPASRAGRSRPEVLAPAGDFDCIKAAVENGADAVYFGLSKFNARARATNFTLDELPGTLEFLRLRGVKGYVAFNTLVFSDELPEAEKTLERIIAAGPDALILQDLGIARLVRDMSRDVPMHASTQTTTTSAEQMALLEELGFSRVILARELSVAEIRKITSESRLPVEVFVHGALCIAYSGQCLTSEALGGRSANRGACAQACRLPYDLVVDGRPHPLGEKQYLLSPQDLAAFELVPELAAAGVVSLKIEGRLKTPEYVAATTRAYRKAVDGLKTTWSRDEVLELQQVFSRGLSRGFLAGIDHQALVPALSPKKRGPFVGKVTAIEGQRVRVVLEAPAKPGDGISFDYGSPDDETGGSVWYVWSDGRRVDRAEEGDDVELGFGELDWSRVHVGDRIWKSSDPALNRKLRATFDKAARRVPVDAVVSGRAGGPLVLELTDGVRRVSARTAESLTPAQKRPLEAEYLKGQVGRLGETTFELRSLESRLEGALFVPVREINEVRREAAAKLEAARKGTPGYEVKAGALGRKREEERAKRDEEGGKGAVTREQGTLVVLCRSLEQLNAAIEAGAKHAHLDFDDIRKYREAVPVARERGVRVALAPPRVHKPGEDGLLKLVASCAPDAVLARSTAHFAFFGGRLPMIGDFSLNVANDLTAGLLFSKGVERVTASYDLTLAQLEAMLEWTDAARVEVVLHQHMAMFHMEHCVIAATLSSGHTAADCGRPCDRHQLSLKDRVGMAHPLRADVGCRNTIFNAVAQSASRHVARLKEKGVGWFRVELMNEDAAKTTKLVSAYRELLEGRREGEKLWQELKASSHFGITMGPLAGKS